MKTDRWRSDLGLGGRTCLEEEEKEKDYLSSQRPLHKGHDSDSKHKVMQTGRVTKSQDMVGRGRTWLQQTSWRLSPPVFPCTNSSTGLSFLLCTWG